MAEEMRPEWVYSRLIAMGMSPHDARRIMDAARKMPEIKKEPDEPVTGTTATGPLFWHKEFDVWDAWNYLFGMTIPWKQETVPVTSHEHIFATNEGVFVVPQEQENDDDLAIRFLVYDAFRDGAADQNHSAR